MHRGGGGARLPPLRLRAGAHHHPYRGGSGIGGPGFRPSGFGGGFHGSVRDIKGDGGNFAKLFVGAVPRTATEEEIRPLFEKHGNVIEVAFIKDRRTGQQQSCCFVKYTTLEAAERAIAAFHNQYTLPRGSGPIQVRLAEGERERLGAFELKLYVGSINKQATEKEIEDIFSPYGGVDDVFILRDDMKKSRGCCFVKLRNREMAPRAINALHGNYLMSGCDQPLIVKFADPKKPRPGELRGGPEFGIPGFHRHSEETPGLRTIPTHTEQLDGHIPPDASCPISPQSFIPSSQTDTKGDPADSMNRTQSSLAMTQSLSPQAHQLEQAPLCDPPSLIQQNSFPDAVQIQNDAFASSDQQPLPNSSMAQIPPQPPLQQSTSSDTHEVFIQQSQWRGMAQSVASASSIPASTMASVTSTNMLPLAMCTTFHIACRWSEHTCPDGFKYYYNCITRESRWEKPDEYAAFEKQQVQKLQQQKQKRQKLGNRHLISPTQTRLHSQTQPIQASQ